jgi:hypothetical protein
MYFFIKTCSENLVQILKWHTTCVCKHRDVLKFECDEISKPGTHQCNCVFTLYWNNPFLIKEHLLECGCGSYTILSSKPNHLNCMFGQHSDSILNILFALLTFGPKTYPTYIRRHIYIINQRDALFIFSLLSYHVSTCFGTVCSQSSGGSKCIYGLDGKEQSSFPSRPSDRRLRRITNIFATYTLAASWWWARNM